MPPGGRSPVQAVTFATAFVTAGRKTVTQIHPNDSIVSPTCHPELDWWQGASLNACLSLSFSLLDRVPWPCWSQIAMHGSQPQPPLSLEDAELVSGLLPPNHSAWWFPRHFITAIKINEQYSSLPSIIELWPHSGNGEAQVWAAKPMLKEE